MKTSSSYPTSGSYFSHICVSVCIYRIMYLPFSLPVFPTLSHKSLSKPNQESGESHELSPVVPCLLFKLSNYSYVQRPDSHTFVFHSFLFKATLRPVRIDWESYMFCFLFSVWDGGRVGVQRQEKAKRELRMLYCTFCFYAGVFITDATDEEEIIPICGCYNIFENKTANRSKIMIGHLCCLNYLLIN